MLRSPSLLAALLGTLVAGCGGSSNQPEEVPEQLEGVIDLDALVGVGFSAAPLGELEGTLAAGDDFTCALREIPPNVVCWGSNERGQLGKRKAVKRGPGAVTAMHVPGAVQVAAGRDHACVRRQNGAVYCWGYHRGGRLGLRQAVPSLAPVAGLKDAVEIAIARDSTCARRNNGRVVCWGPPRLGHVPEFVPLPIPAVPPAVSVGGGVTHHCLVPKSSDVVCWGNNADRHLGGQPSEGRAGIATNLIRGTSGLGQVAAGMLFTCGVDQAGAVLCWGRNHAGQLGRGTVSLVLTDPLRAPAKVLQLGDAVEVALGDEHACARRRDGSVVCWGSNDEAQLGDGTFTSRPVPAPVRGLAGVVELAAGGYHTCARLQDGSCWCWGNNQSGQLGVIETIDRSSYHSGHHRLPVKVDFLGKRTLREMAPAPRRPPSKPTAAPPTSPSRPPAGP